jgi:hypothetical protein
MSGVQAGDPLGVVGFVVFGNRFSGSHDLHLAVSVGVLNSGF